MNWRSMTRMQAVNCIEGPGTACAGIIALIYLNTHASRLAFDSLIQQRGIGPA